MYSPVSCAAIMDASGYNVPPIQGSQIYRPAKYTL